MNELPVKAEKQFLKVSIVTDRYGSQSMLQKPQEPTTNSDIIAKDIPKDSDTKELNENVIQDNISSSGIVIESSSGTTGTDSEQNTINARIEDQNTIQRESQQPEDDLTITNSSSDDPRESNPLQSTEISKRKWIIATFLYEKLMLFIDTLIRSMENALTFFVCFRL